jgi:hypothetical protein
VKGAMKTFDFSYELTARLIRLSADDGSGTTEIIALDKTELVCKDTTRAYYFERRAPARPREAARA